MHKIKILSVGKIKETWLEQAVEEYVKRLKPCAQIDFEWVKNDTQLLQIAQSSDNVLCLDPEGQQFSSEEFSEFLMQRLVKGGSRLTLVIGGPEGLPPELKKNAHLFSLSRMTFTHQVTRLVLLEQVYRAFEILKGSKYHK